VFDKNKEKLELVRGKVIKTQQGIAGLGRFEYIVEATGNRQALRKAIHESRTGATILLLGFPYGDFNFNFETIVSYDKSIIGSVGSTREDFKEAIQIYDKLNLQEFTKHIFTLDEYEEAWAKRREGKILKAIIKVH
jgi:threonine dehydrogenase-like Zn-dependent dehydrogenase